MFRRAATDSRIDYSVLTTVLRTPYRVCYWSFTSRRANLDFARDKIGSESGIGIRLKAEWTPDLASSANEDVGRCGYRNFAEWTSPRLAVA